MEIDHIIVLDVETTGLAEPVGVCEIGIIELCPNTLKEIGRFESLIDPEMPITFSASGVHRIVSDMVQDSPTLKEYFEIVLEGRYTGKNVLMVAHNAAYDYPKVKEHLGDSQSLCTLKLAKKILPDAENHKLATMKFQYGLGAGGKSHSALADAEDCADLLRMICHESDMSLLELCELQRVPNVIKIMPFSKHKGEPLCDVPVSFWNWLAKQEGEGQDADLVHSVKLLHPKINLKEKKSG